MGLSELKKQLLEADEALKEWNEHRKWVLNEIRRYVPVGETVEGVEAVPNIVIKVDAASDPDIFQKYRKFLGVKPTLSLSQYNKLTLEQKTELEEILLITENPSTIKLKG